MSASWPCSSATGTRSGSSRSPRRPAASSSTSASNRSTSQRRSSWRNVEALRFTIERDRGADRRPFLVVATAGSTAAGAIDPVSEIADVCLDSGLDLHVDAAWAGTVILSPRLRPLLDGIERADSVTIDAHKWLSAPMGAGVFLTPHAEELTRAFQVQTNYMPSAAAADPYLMSAPVSLRSST
jgi:aromatic-L-amino-acid/L-tryptophan decarboxylase